MSCIFCGDLCHLSQNCEIYSTDEAREKVAKKYCHFCLLDKSCKHKHNKKKCRKYQRCFICFSKQHHTVYCPERFMDAYLFIPNIDGELFFRFLKTFNHREQYTLAFSSPKVFKFFSRMPEHNVINYLKIDDTNFYHYLDLNIAANELKILNLQSKHENLSAFFKLVTQNILIIKIRVLEIRNAEISPHDFLQLLPACLKLIKCYDLKIPIHPIFFDQILQRTPNLIEIVMNETNIIIKDTWIDEIMKYNSCCKKFRKLSIDICSINFDVEKLVDFMKVNSTKNLQINLFIRHPTLSPPDLRQALSLQLSNYFIEFNQSSSNLSSKNIPLLELNILECELSQGCKGYGSIPLTLKSHSF